jgi:hypothetical protein
LAYEFEIQFAKPSRYLDLLLVITVSMLTHHEIFRHSSLTLLVTFYRFKRTLSKGGEGGATEIKILQSHRENKCKCFIWQEQFLVALL